MWLLIVDKILLSRVTFLRGYSTSTRTRGSRISVTWLTITSHIASWPMNVIYHMSQRNMFFLPRVLQIFTWFTQGLVHNNPDTGAIRRHFCLLYIYAHGKKRLCYSLLSDLPFLAVHSLFIVTHNRTILGLLRSGASRGCNLFFWPLHQSCSLK